MPPQDANPTPSFGGFGVSYIDDNQVVSSFANTINASTTEGTQGWYANWLQGSGPLLDPDERVEIHVNISALNTLLAISTKFRIEVKPQVGATLVVERTTDAELKSVNNMHSAYEDKGEINEKSG